MSPIVVHRETNRRIKMRVILKEKAHLKFYQRYHKLDPRKSLLTICNLSSAITLCCALASTSSSDVIFSISSTHDLEDIPGEKRLEFFGKSVRNLLRVTAALLRLRRGTTESRNRAGNTLPQRHPSGFKGTSLQDFR